MRYLSSLRFRLAACLFAATCLLLVAVFLLPERRCAASCRIPRVVVFPGSLIELTRLDDGAAVLPETVGVPFSLCLSRQEVGVDRFVAADCYPMPTFYSDWTPQ